MALEECEDMIVETSGVVKDVIEGEENLAVRLQRLSNERVYRLLRGKTPQDITALIDSIPHPHRVGRIVKDRFLTTAQTFASLLAVANDLENALSQPDYRVPEQPPLSLDNLYSSVGAVAKQLFCLAADYESELSNKEKENESLVKKISELNQRNLTTIRENKELYRAIMTDPLTGIYSRRFFFINLPDRIQIAEKHKEPLSVIVIDINNFKLINDTYGHDGGDFLLKSFAKFGTEQIPKAYVFARLGGDEFGIILPGAKEQEAYNFADEFRKQFKATKFIYTVQEGDEEFDYGVGTTIALGVKQYEPGESADNLFRGADAAFYIAHKMGKDKTVKYTDFSKHYKTMPSASRQFGLNIIARRPCKK